MIFLEFITLLEATVIILEINLLYNTLHLLDYKLATNSILTAVNYYTGHPLIKKTMLSEQLI
jgi:hypothetical protein